jgi:hypothetical protein
MRKKTPRRFLPYLAALLAVAFPNLVGARCAGVPLREVRSLNGLPGELRRLLPERSTGLDGIADSGGDYNVTDVVDPKLPMRRFSLAAVGDDCAVIAVERGGYSHYFEVTEYRLVGGAWHSLGTENVGRKPNSTDELLTRHDGR